MINSSGHNWRDTIDWALIITLFSILGLGVLTVTSATFNPANPDASLYRSQLIWVAIGLGTMLVSATVNYRILLYISYPLYAIAIGLLVLVLVQGKVTMGASRWLRLGGLSFQPSELMKLTLIMTLARYFHFDLPRPQYALRDLFVPALFVVIPFFLIAKQPDLGTALLLGGTACCMFLFMNIRKRTLAIMLAIGIVAAPFAYHFALKPYQKRRVLSFINPFSDPRGAGYNSIQSMIAVGSGQFLGKGFKKGTQAQLDFIPEHHTDFAFSVFSEEHGFAGCALLLTLYASLVVLAFRVAARAKDRFGLFLAVGLASHFLLQAFINIGMVTGILPVVGVALPFISYGGTNMIISMISIGLLLNVSFRRYTF